jgi:hypothetical protein
LIPAEAMSWLDSTLDYAPDTVEEQISAFERPTNLPETLLDGLGAKLSAAAGLAKTAYVVSVRYGEGGRGHLLGFVGAPKSAQPALAKSAGEALTFSGIEAGQMDVGFFEEDDPATAKLKAVGLRFDLPELEPATVRTVAAPGSDPQKPPILR